MKLKKVIAILMVGVLGISAIPTFAGAAKVRFPAQTVAGRTVIPLRAMVAAMDKAVFWDDRGLIVISDMQITYKPETVNYMVDMLK